MRTTSGANLPYPEGGDVPLIAEELTDLARAIDPRIVHSRASLKSIAAANSIYSDQRGMLAYQADGSGNIWAYIGPGTAVGDLVGPTTSQDTSSRKTEPGWVLLSELVAQSGDYRSMLNVGAIPMSLDVDVLGGSFAGTARLTAAPTGEDGSGNAYRLPATPDRKYRVLFCAWTVLTASDDGAKWDLVMRCGRDLDKSGEYAISEMDGPRRNADYVTTPMRDFVANAGDLISWEVHVVKRSGGGNVQVDQANDSRGAWVIAWPIEQDVSVGGGSSSSSSPAMSDDITPVSATTDATMWSGWGHGYAWPQPDPVAATTSRGPGVKVTLNDNPEHFPENPALIALRVPPHGVLNGFVIGQRYKVEMRARCSASQPQRWRPTVGYSVSGQWQSSTTSYQTAAMEFIAQQPEYPVGIEVEPPASGWASVGDYTIVDIQITRQRTPGSAPPGIYDGPVLKPPTPWQPPITPPLDPGTPDEEEEAPGLPPDEPLPGPPDDEDEPPVLPPMPEEPPPADTPDVTPPPPTPTKIRWNIASYNCPSRYGGTAAAIKRLAEQYDVSVIGFQERVNPTLPSGWQLYNPSRDGSRLANPIGWDGTIWSANNTGTFKISPARTIAAPSPNQRPRYIVWARLEHRAYGWEFWFGSVHLLFDKYSHSSRTNLWKLQRDNCVSWLRRTQRNILVGDFNTNPTTMNMMQPLHNNATVLVGGAKTHAKGKLDHIWIRDDQPINPVTASALPGFNSDHKPLMGSLERELAP